MIDWARVGELQSEIGPEDFAEVSLLFLEEVAEKIEEICSGLADDDHLSALHYVKGCAHNLGFAALGGLCEELERTGGGGAAASTRVRQCFEQSQAEFAAGPSATCR